MSKKKEENRIKVQSDEELNAFIIEKKKKATKGLLIMILGILFVIITGAIGILLGIVIGTFIIVLGFSMRYTAKNERKDCMAQAALIPALNEVFEQVEYHPEQHIPSSVIRNTPMGFSFSVDVVEGNDLIKASYHGVSIELSDITLKSEKTTKDSDGEPITTEKTEFRGLWLIADFHKKFSADLLLRERSGMLDKQLKKGIQTENDTFNRQFYIESESEHDVFYILTPHMMEYIQNMNARSGGRTYMRFLKNGKLILANDTRRDAFEVHNISKANAAALREQFKSEVRYVTDLIDELKLVKTLHEQV